MVKDAGILRGDSSMEEKVVIILNEMSEYLSISQMKKLQEVILKTFSENEAKKQEISNHDFLKMFLDAKKIEGCSERTIQYYKVTVEHLLSKIEESVRKITTEEIWSEVFNNKETIAYESWPTYDKSKLENDTYEMVVQVNGVLRGKVQVPVSYTEVEMKETAKKIENVNIRN